MLKDITEEMKLGYRQLRGNVHLVFYAFNFL